jgi:hypothetical protein
MMGSSRSPSFIVHVGPHKTGTTYLQLSFRKLRKELAARGTIFPECWQLASGPPGQVPLVSKLRNGQIDLLIPEFATLLASGADRILISSEDISDLDRAALARLRDLTAGHPIQIIFYVRRWSELMPSAWQETIKHGHYQTLPEFMLTHLERPEESRLLNFDMRLSVFCEIFGDASVTLVSYNELRDRNIDLFQHFAGTFLGWLNAPTAERLRASNTSRAPAEAELLRALNAMGRAHQIHGSVAIRKAFDRMEDKTVPAQLAAAMKRHTRNVRLSDNLPALRRLHESLAEKYNSRTVPARSSQQLFEPLSRDIEMVGGDYMAELQAGAALRDIFAKIRATLVDAAPIDGQGSNPGRSVNAGTAPSRRKLQQGVIATPR